MAKGMYQKLYEARMERLGKTKSADLENKVNNIKARLEAGGVDPEAAVDDRNAIEKFLNLDQNQGFFGDVFEILGRPQQALFGGWKAAQEGGSFGEGALKGLTGDEETQFKEILTNYGMKDEKGKLDAADILGFAGDVFLDPADLVPLAGFGKAAKILDDTGDIFKAYKATDSLSDLAFKGAGKAIKGGAKVADKGIEKGLKYLDETQGVRAFDKQGNLLNINAKLNYANTGAKQASDLGKYVTNQGDFIRKVASTDPGRLETYKKLKNETVDMFKKSDASVKALLSKRSADNTGDEIKNKLIQIAKENEDLVGEYAKQKGKDIAKVNEDITLYVESYLDRTTTRKNLLKHIRQGTVAPNENITRILDDIVSELPENLREGLDLSWKKDKKGFIKLGSGWNENVLKTNIGDANIDYDDMFDKRVDFGNWYTKDDLAELDNLRNDTEFKGLIKNIFGDVSEGDKIIYDPVKGNFIFYKTNADSQRAWSQSQMDFMEDLKAQGLDTSEILKHTRKSYDEFGRPKGYTQTSNSFRINENIRQNSTLDRDLDTIENLDKGIKQHKTKRDLGLVRKESSTTIKKLFGLPDGLSNEETVKALKQFIDEPVSNPNKGYTSTAVGYGSNYFSGRDATMEIKAPKGSHLFVDNSAEREAILGRGQKMVLRRADYDRATDSIKLSLDLFDGEGRKIATIQNNLIDDANAMLDNAFKTNIVSKNLENSGYIPHILADQDMYYNGVDVGSPILKGNVSTLNERTYLGSAREINNLYKQSLSDGTDMAKAYLEKYPKLFEENFNKAFTHKYVDELTGLAKQNKIVNDVIIEQTLGDAKTIKKLQQDIHKFSLAGDTENLAKATAEYNKLTENATIKYLTKYDNKVPQGFTKVSISHAKQIKNKLSKMAKALNINDNSYQKLIKLFSTGDSIALNNDVLRMLEVSIDDKNLNAFGRVYNKWLNLFKSTKTLSPTFLTNNLVGNSSNLYLSGIGITDQARLVPKAMQIVKEGPELYNRKLAGEVLTKSQDELANMWKNFLDTGFGKEEIALDIQDTPEFLKDIATKGRTNKKITAKDVATVLPKINMRANTFMDNINRVAVMLKAIEDPSYLTKLGIEGSTELEKWQKAISKVMFDPTMLTDFEKNTMKKIIPFYTFTKNNLIYHLDNLQRNGSKYNQVMKGIKSLQESATGGEDENMADYLKNSLYIPIPALGEDGDYTILRTTLPFGQVIETFENPVQTIANSIGPLGKAPYEYATGIDVFTGRPIESFPGEKSSQIPFLTKKQQKLISDLSGLDVPLKVGSRMFEGIQEASQDDEGVLEGLRRGALNNLTIQGNVDTDRLNRSYEELDELETLMKQYEQEGYEFSTLNELKQANKNNTMASINAIFAKYGIE